MREVTSEYRSLNGDSHDDFPPRLFVVVRTVEASEALRPSAYLISAARGRVVDEPALVDALARRQIRGAALDVTADEPLPAASPLWAMENVLITPHTAGETRRYEDNVLDILLENLDRLWRGEAHLRNQVV